MISRRESLRTVAAGGAAVVGATVVRTVPAFAYDAPVVTTPFVLSVQGSDNPFSTVLQAGQATCPGSAVACLGCSSGIAQNMVLEVTASVLANYWANSRWGWGDALDDPLDVTNEFTISPKIRSVDPVLGGILNFSKYRIDINNPRPAKVGDVLLMVGRAVYRCTYPGGSFAEVTETQAISFAFNGTEWVPGAAPG